MAASGNTQRNIFGILEDFLIKVASLDVFEVLIFNYKLKPELLDDLSCNFIPIIDELINEVQELLNEYKSKSVVQCENSNELYLFSPLDERYESDNVPANEKPDNKNVNEDGQPLDLISTSVLREMPLFSPKCVIEDNIGVDSTESLWNSDSKSSDVLPNQIHIPEISEHSTTIETCNSFQCLSCHRLFGSDFKLSAHTCKNDKDKPIKNISKVETEVPDKLNAAKTNQEFPLDFRHSTEIGSLIEDALQIPKEEYGDDNSKSSNDKCAIIVAVELEECDMILKESGGTNVENKSIIEYHEMPKDQELNKQNRIYATKNLEGYKNGKNDSNPLKQEAVGNKLSGRVSRSRKRTIEIVSDRSKSEKSEGAFRDESGRKCRNEDISERALVNTVIVSSKSYENNVEERQMQGKAKVVKKKGKRKDKEEVLKKDLIKKVDEEADCKENKVENNTKWDSKDCCEFSEIKCSGSSFTPFICCGDCFHVHKDWDSYDSHVCNSSNANKETLKTSVGEHTDDDSRESLVNVKENDGKDSEEPEKETSTASNIIEENKVKDDVLMGHFEETKVNPKTPSTEVQALPKRSSVITDQETLLGIHRFVCSVCLEEYRSLNRMMYHLPRCVTGPYKCELCPLEYVSRRELNLHKKKNHRDAQSFICDECGVKFKFRTSLQKHKVNRHERWVDKETHSCPHCTLTFPKKIYLTNHCIKIHRLERKFLCQICGKKFLNQNSLNSHLNYHTDEAKSRFSCSHCSKTFLRKEKLQYHLRIHTGERPFVCKSCSKTFISKAKLTEHLWRHGGKKRYSCPLCPKKYAGRWDLKLHVRKMHGRILNSRDGNLLESGNDVTSESTNTSSPEMEKESSSSVSTSKVEILNNGTSEISSTEVLVVGEVQNGVPEGVNESDGIVVQLASVSNLGQAVLPAETLLTLANTMEHPLPHGNSQHPQFIQLNSSSATSAVPIHIQVSSSTQGFDVSSQPGIIFTSGLYLS